MELLTNISSLHKAQRLFLNRRMVSQLHSRKISGDLEISRLTVKSLWIALGCLISKILFLLSAFSMKKWMSPRMMYQEVRQAERHWCLNLGKLLELQRQLNSSSVSGLYGGFSTTGMAASKLGICASKIRLVRSLELLSQLINFSISI